MRRLLKRTTNDRHSRERERDRTLERNRLRVTGPLGGPVELVVEGEGDASRSKVGVESCRWGRRCEREREREGPGIGDVGEGKVSSVGSRLVSQSAKKRAGWGALDPCGWRRESGEEGGVRGLRLRSRHNSI